ncbi:MAG: HAMP domain-containing sensor histidine kinase [Lachnospiraceae bacterium]|nr:HAMP domain-containing sensor histidine kinase [Lachnospiraceae bacterium]
MIQLMIGMCIGVIVSGIGYYIHYYKKEEKLLAHLQQMLDEALNGDYNVSEFSEEKLSLIENSFKQYLDNSLIAGEEQKEQKEMIQMLISDIAHQTLTPISNVKLYTGLLQENYGDDELIQTVSEETDKLDFLIQSLVKLSRMENGMISVHPKETSVNIMLMAIQNLYWTKAEQKEITLTSDFTEEVAVFDLKWTIEAIGNIVDNAVKYTPSGGKISVSIQKYSFFVRIDISDTGIGIAEEEIPKIFTRFYRSFEVSELPGVGIGLYLTKYIIQEQKGYIKVTSQKDKGSVFSVFLPSVSNR